MVSISCLADLARSEGLDFVRLIGEEDQLDGEDSPRPPPDGATPGDGGGATSPGDVVEKGSFLFGYTADALDVEIRKPRSYGRVTCRDWQCRLLDVLSDKVLTERARDFAQKRRRIETDDVGGVDENIIETETQALPDDEKHELWPYAPLNSDRRWIAPSHRWITILEDEEPLRDITAKLDFTAHEYRVIVCALPRDVFPDGQPSENNEKLFEMVRLAADRGEESNNRRVELWQDRLSVLTLAELCPFWEENVHLSNFLTGNQALVTLSGDRAHIPDAWIVVLEPTVEFWNNSEMVLFFLETLSKRSVSQYGSADNACDFLFEDKIPRHLLEDRSFIRQAVSLNGDVLRFLPQNSPFRADREIVFLAVGSLYRGSVSRIIAAANEKFRDDETFLRCAKNVETLLSPVDIFRIASPRLQDDIAFVRYLIADPETTFGAGVFGEVSERLRDDLDLVLFALCQERAQRLREPSRRFKLFDDLDDPASSSPSTPAGAATVFSGRDFLDNRPTAFQYASDRLRADRASVLRAVRVFPDSLGDAVDSLRDDEEVVRVACEKNEPLDNRNRGGGGGQSHEEEEREKDYEYVPVHALRFASARLRGERVFVRSLVNELSPFAILYASEELWDDEETVELVVRKAVANLSAEEQRWFFLAGKVFDSEAAAQATQVYHDTVVDDDGVERPEHFSFDPDASRRWISHRLQNDERFMRRLISQIDPRVLPELPARFLRAEDHGML